MLFLGGCGAVITLLVSMTVTNVNDSVTARASVRFTTADGLQDSTDLLLVKENGTWRPCP